jgi:DHA1 family bicyclomycin/chloramphenicol resistance-like MFS transporter
LQANYLLGSSVPIYCIALTTFVLFLSTQVGVPALPALSAQLGADARAMAATLSAALMTLVLLQFFTGLLADRYGRRKVLVSGAFLGGISSLLCAVVGHWQLLLWLRILGGMADAIAMPALLGLTAEIAGGRHGAFFGILRSSQGLSFVVAPAIGGWLSLWGLRAPFVVDGLLSLLACAILSFTVRERRDTGSGGRSTDTLSQLRSLFADRRVHTFFLFGVVNNFAFPILSSFVPTKGLLLGLAPWQLSVLIAAEAVAYTISSYFAGRFSDRWGRRQFMVWAQPMIILACLGLAWSRDLLGLVLFYALFGLGSSMTFLMSSVMVADITPPERCATVLGAFDAAIDMVLFVAPALALALYGPLGRIEPLLVLASAPAWIALLAAWRLEETRPVAVVS